MKKYLFLTIFSVLPILKAHAWPVTLDALPQPKSVSSDGQICMTQTIHVTCDKMQAVDILNQTQKTKQYKKVILESRIIDTAESTQYGCDMLQPDAYFISAVICE
ncbi:MAG: hypothetical protein AAGB31_14725 [Bdellovibrio sp.]